MGELRRTPIKIDGKKGMIVHNSLCADGPVDLETGEPLIDPNSGIEQIDPVTQKVIVDAKGNPILEYKKYPGANDDMADLLHDYLKHLRSIVYLKGGITAPRFGVISLIAMHTPIYVYDHPAFKKVANTAFTDGRSIFVDADFMRKLHEEEEASGDKKSGIIFVLLHETLHKLLCHVDRLKGFDPIIANIAEDMVINGKLIKGFPDVKPIDLLVEILYGMKQADAEKYHTMSEEVVAELLTYAEKKKEKQKKDKDKAEKQKSSGNDKDDSGEGYSEDNEEENSNKSGSGKPSKNGKKKSPSNSDSQESKESEEEENGEENSSVEGQPKKSSKKKGGKDKSDDGDLEDDLRKKYSPIHHISREELMDILDENDLQDTVGKALGMPSKGDAAGIGKMEEQNKMNMVDAVQTAMAQSRKSQGNYPGAHIAEYAEGLITNLGKGKLTYKLVIRKHFIGDGNKLAHSDEQPGIPYLLDKITTGLDPFYIGSSIPQAPDEAVYVLVDSSGSTGGGTMRKEFLEEALNIQQSISGAGDCARKVFIQSADTILRGEPILITSANINRIRHDGIPIFGDGGTSFETVLKQGLEQPMLKKEKVKVVFYFTDCIDSIPQREDFEEHLNKGMKIVFITTPGMFNEKWNQQLTWAEVYCMEEGTVVDTSKTEQNQSRNTRRQKSTA